MRTSTLHRATREIRFGASALTAPCGHPGSVASPWRRYDLLLRLLSLIALASGCREQDAPDAATKTKTLAEPAGTTGNAPGFFTDIADEAGLRFTHQSGFEGKYSYPEIMGAGCALLDVDNDGDLDAYLVNGAGPGRLFRREADGTYRDVTDASGLSHGVFGMGVAAGDYDNDGWVDLYLTNFGPNLLYHNRGDGSFEDVTASAGIHNPKWSVSASFFDYDRDGFLDLYVANYVHYPQAKSCTDDAGRIEFCGPTSAPPVGDVLYHNRGDGTFEDVSVAAGIAALAGPGMGVMTEDFNADGLLDVYVTNDGAANYLWINNGNGTFTESALMLGAAVNRFGRTQASMGVAAGDIEGDGDIDLIMTNMIREGSRLCVNDGTGGFFDSTAEAGLAAPSLPMTGFGTAFLDFDNDGDLDLAVANGRIKHADLVAGVDATNPLAAYAERNQLFRNIGRGRFENASALAGDFGQTVRIARGLAAGDIDNDGDIDLLVSNTHGPAELLRNDAPKTGHWLIVRAVDPALKRDAYGAKIIASAGDRWLLRTVNPAYSYGSSGDPRVHFGLGPATRVEALEVTWPDGSTERYTDIAVDQIVTIRRGDARVAAEGK